jgi:hypothetical protein
MSKAFSYSKLTCALLQEGSKAFLLKEKGRYRGKNKINIQLFWRKRNFLLIFIVMYIENMMKGSE